MAGQLQKLTPNIMVEDVNRTVQFYQEVLGFELLASVPEEGQFDWAQVQRGGVQLMFESRSSLGGDIPYLKETPIGATLSLYIEMSGVDDLYTQLKERVTVAQDLHTTSYGAKVFVMLDCNGYILAFAENQ